MAKSANSQGSQAQTGRGQSSHKGPGGNWPATTGSKSGSGRGNAAPKGK